jgi:hypothetical protein
LLAACAALLLSGCGAADGDSSFGNDDYPFSFDYPSSWTLTRGTSSPNRERATPMHGVVVALKAPLNQATVTQYWLKKPIPQGEHAFQPEVDRVVNRLATEAGGKRSEAKKVNYGGADGYQYTISYKAGGQQLENRLTFLFKDEDEFQIACQSSADQREEMNNGCETILESLKLNP